jgi:mannosyl-3-phosphoglycerate phosphatase
MRRVLVFTDLDGTLLDAHDFNWTAASPVLEQLRALQIPVIPVTSRTRAEVIRLRQDTGLDGPFIVESGSAIMLPRAHSEQPQQNAREGARIVLGCTWAEAAHGRELLQRRLGVMLTAFSQLQVTQVASLTGLHPQAAALAGAREYGEVIVRSADTRFELAAEAARGLGFRLLDGDRFWHLVGSGADKGRAVRRLLAHLDQADTLTIALGNGPSDLGVLEAVDIPIIVPGEAGPHAAFERRDWRVAPAPGPRGWAAALSAVLEELGAGASGTS